MRCLPLTGLLLAGTMLAAPASADILPRPTTPAGAVIARKTGEEAKFIEVPTWRIVDINQDVVAGDVLRTNANGNLAVLFSDRTQMRLGRNTTLLVKQVGATSDSAFELQSGTLWARAERGGAGLTIDTPAAAAAIRGTDWTMSVNGDTTSLIVLEGEIEFSNPQGSVSLTAGEAATATIGQAPSKTVVTDSDDREQMQFYFSLRGRDTSAILPATTLSSTAIGVERKRLDGLAPAARTAEDWITLAEIRLQYEGPEAATAAADEANRFRLNAAQEARLALVRANAAYQLGRYAEAASLYERSLKSLDAERRSVARFGSFFARSLANPELQEAPPSGQIVGVGGAIAEAVTAAYIQGIPEGIEVLRQAEQRYPQDASLPAIRSRFALLIDDRQQTEEAIARALILDPENTFALETRAYYRAGVKGDVEGALEDAELAVSIAPGAATLWNTYGLAQSQRGAVRESIDAMKKAIELDPADALSRTNLAFIYLEENRFAEAKAQIDIALQLDPSLDAALAARGRYYLQTNDYAKAQQDLLAATTANPASAQSLLLLAAAHYQAGDDVAGEQALDNADRLDRNDPVIASVRTTIAVHEYRADDAIIAAQDALKRTRDRGGDYAALSASQDAGSTLNSAFRLLNLDAWGRFYGDAVFDPFAGSSFFDQSLAGSVNPFINSLRFGSVATEPTTNDTSASSLLQGLLLSPQSLAAPSGNPTALLYPFLEVTAGGGVTIDNGDAGWQASLEVQGFAANPAPTSIYVNIEGLEAGSLRGDDPIDTGQFRLDDQSITGTGYVASRPTVNDAVVGYVSSSNFDYNLGVVLPDILVDAFGEELPSSGDTRSTNAGVAWAHTFGYHNVATVGFLTNLLEDGSSADTPFVTPDGIPLVLRTDIDNDQQTYIGAANHSVELGDVTLRYGFEAGTIRGDTLAVLSLPQVPVELEVTALETDVETRRAYFDALYEITPDLKIEAGLFGTSLRGEFAGTDVNEDRLEPRVGVAWSPLEGQYLRAGYLREASVLSSTTLAPIGVVGLQSNQARLAPNGYTDTIAARWESQWNTRLFTAVDYQHQEFHDLTIGVPTTADAISLTEGRLDRVSATANIWIGGGLGAFATYAYTDSSNEDPASVGFSQRLAFVPEHSGRVGLTYVHPRNVKATLAATYVGDRVGDEAGSQIDGYWSADAFLTWEPFDKRVVLDLAAYNLFDEDFAIAPQRPGWGRTFVGSLKVRF